MSDSLMVETLRKGLTRVMQERDGLKAAYQSTCEQILELKDELGKFQNAPPTLGEQAAANRLEKLAHEVDIAKAQYQLNELAWQDDKTVLQEKIAALQIQLADKQNPVMTVHETCTTAVVEREDLKETLEFAEGRIDYLLNLLRMIEDCKKMPQVRELITSYFDHLNASESV
jgi:chromosome segregation ATPase